MYQISIDEIRAWCELSYEWWGICLWACAAVLRSGLLLGMLVRTQKLNEALGIWNFRIYVLMFSNIKPNKLREYEMFVWNSKILY